MFDGIYRDEMEGRPVYAIDVSDFDEYLREENENKAAWATLEEFAQSCRNQTLSEVVVMYACNLLRYHVRMNEYLRANFYTGLRLPADMVRQLIGDNKNENCLRVTVKARRILAFAKSVGSSMPYGSYYSRCASKLKQ